MDRFIFVLKLRQYDSGIKTIEKNTIIDSFERYQNLVSMIGWNHLFYGSEAQRAFSQLQSDICATDRETLVNKLNILKSGQTR